MTSLQAPPAADEAHEATRGGAVKLLIEAAVRVLSAATTLLLARSLGVQGFGEYAVVSAVALLAAEVSDLGLQGTASRALVAGDHSLRTLASAKAFLTLAMAALAAFALTACSFLGAAGLSEPLAVHARSLALLAGYFTLSGWVEFAGVALRSHRRPWAEGAVLLVLRASALAALLLVVDAPASLPAAAAALALSPLPAAACGLLLLRGHWSAAAAQRPASVAALLRQSLPLALNARLTQVALRIEVFALASLRGPSEAGLFMAALKVAEFANLVPAAVASGAMPALTRDAVRGRADALRRTAIVLAFFAVPGAVGLGLVAPELVRVAYGPAYEGAVAALAILAPGLVPLYANTLLMNALLARGRAPILPWLTAVRLALAAGLAALLVPRFGVAGAAAGFVAAEFALTLAAARAMTDAARGLRLLPKLGAAALACLPMAAVVALFRSAPLALRIAVGATTYAATLLLLLLRRASPVLPAGPAVGAGMPRVTEHG